MNHVWPSIACRLANVASQPRTKPLLHLFNGYARCSRNHALPSYAIHRSLTNAPNAVSSSGSSIQLGGSHRAFSTTPTLAGKSNSKAKKSTSKLNISSKPTARSKQDAKARLASSPRTPSPASTPTLGPAPTVASHAEGTLEAEEEVLTWRDYDPVGGMPLPDGELNETEIRRVFQSEQMDIDTGNYILSVMHWRRLSGALIDVGLDFPKDSGVDRDMALKGLQYVRTLAPDVNESERGVQWAKEEEQRLEEEIQTRAVKLGLYKRVSDVEEEQDQGTEEGRARNEQSALQNIREESEAQFEQEQARKAAAEERAQIAAVHAERGPLELGAGVQPIANSVQLLRSPGGVAIGRPVRKAWLEPVERKPWVKYYEEHAQTFKDNAIPQLSTIRRLGPSFLMLLSVLAGAYYLSENYTPPPKSARVWPEWAPSVATMIALTSLLSVTFLMGRFPPLWGIFNKYLTLTPAYPYALSLIGATLRHEKVGHLGSNLLSLWLFGLLFHEDVGRGTFLAIYLASGAAGGFSSLFYNVLRKEWAAYICGSSGCIIGVVAAACTLRPNRTIKVFSYEIPVAAWMFLAVFGALETFAMVRGMKTMIDHAGHVGGMIMGICSGLYLRRKIRDDHKVQDADASLANAKTSEEKSVS